MKLYYILFCIIFLGIQLIYYTKSLHIPINKGETIHSNNETYCDETLSNACKIFKPKNDNPIFTSEDCPFGFHLDQQINRCSFSEDDAFEKEIKISGCIYGMNRNVTKCFMDYCAGMCGFDRIFSISALKCINNPNSNLCGIYYDPELHFSKKIINTKNYCFVGFKDIEDISILVYTAKTIEINDSFLNEVNSILTKIHLYYAAYENLNLASHNNDLNIKIYKNCVDKVIKDYYHLGNKFKNYLKGLDYKKRHLTEDLINIINNFKQVDATNIMVLYFDLNTHDYKTLENDFFIYYNNPDDMINNNLNKCY